MTEPEHNRPVRDLSALEAALESVRAANEGSDGSGRGRKSQATELIELAFANAEELWHDPAGHPWGTLRTNGHLEHWRVDSEGMRRWLRGLYFEAENKAPGSQGVQDAIDLLEVFAFFRGQEHPVYLRVAEHEGRVYLDLGDAAWSVVEIQADSWRLVDRAPVRFRRARGMFALPIPDPAGSLDELRRFVNVASDDDWRLLVAWPLFAWRADRPHPPLVLRGEQGSAKSTTGRILRSLIDLTPWVEELFEALDTTGRTTLRSTGAGSSRLERRPSSFQAPWPSWTPRSPGLGSGSSGATSTRPPTSLSTRDSPRSVRS